MITSRPLWVFAAIVRPREPIDIAPMKYLLAYRHFRRVGRV
jgi:hypothetical protein